MERFRLLFIDDDPAIREVAEWWLPRLGPFAVDSTFDATEAISLAREGDYRAIIADLRLPNMDHPQADPDEIVGLELIRQIRAFSALPIIVITAHDSPQMRRLAQAAGATAFESKPISWRELGAYLLKALSQRSITQATLDEHFEQVQPLGRVPALFIAYAYEDVDHLLRLDHYLRPLERQGQLTIWHGEDILPGRNVAAEIKRHLAEANLILMLISADFLASDKCHEQAQVALERHQAGQAVAVPITVRAAAWTASAIGELPPLPASARPITSWPNQDEAWQEVIEGIRFISLKLRSEL